MTHDNVLSTLNDIFKEIFDDEEICINDTTVSDDIEDWDSIMHISLILAIENEFGIKFSIKEITSMKNVRSMVDLILEKMK